MDSWSDKQLALMKAGGNDKCNEYLKARGINPRTPIKAKYESEAAQLYKEVLKARVEGRPEPTSLPKKTPSAPSSMNRPMTSISSGGGGGAGGAGDPNGMERLAGESDQQYIARQTRLREEARARMQAKFGNSGGRMGGVGSGGMQGIGSNPSYNPNTGGYGDVMSGVTSAFSTGMSLVGSVASSAANTVSSVVQEDSSARANISQVTGSFWSTLSNGISSVADTITQPDQDDGLMDLQRQFSHNRPTQSKYGGFGSDSMNGGSQSNYGGFGSNSMNGSNGASQFSSQPTRPIRSSPPSSTGMPSAPLGEAPGLPGEDRNGIERLTGESDDQYVARQTRLRDEAKARMAAKFGGGGMSSMSSSSVQNNGSSYSSTPSRVTSAPASSNFVQPTATTPPKPKIHTPPRSGGLPPARKLSNDNLTSDDFFASFGA